MSAEAREALVAACRRLIAEGLTTGTSGNVSVREGPGMLISPSATPAEAMSAASVAAMALDGGEAWDGPLRPSSEWRFHRDILRDRPEIGAVVHAHPRAATALAMLRRPIPPCHYMVLAFGGRDVRVAGYATFGMQALSDAVLAALEGRTACLMANHGAIALGETLERAMWRMGELEALAAQYLAALAVGEPVPLSEAELAAAEAAFAGYGAGGRLTG